MSESVFNLSKFIDNSLDLLFVATQDARYVYASPSANKVLGYTNEELFSSTYFSFIHPDDLEKTKTVAEQLNQNKSLVSNFSNRYICKNGEIKHILWTAWLQDDFIYAIAKDVTELFDSQFKYEQSKMVIEKIFESLPCAVYQFELTADGKTTTSFFSRQLELILGINLENETVGLEWVAKHLPAPDGEEFRRLTMESAKNLTEFKWFGAFPSPTRGTRWLELRSTPQRLDNGTTLWYGICIDVTERVQTHQELESIKLEALHAAKLAALGEMAAGVAHEINNPLAIISGYADRILRFSSQGRLDPEEAKRLAEKILSSTNRIESTVKSLLNLSRKSPENFFELKNVSEIIDDALNVCAEKFHSHGIQIKRLNHHNNIIIRCAPSEIAQIILNLLNNAYDAVCGMENPWIKIETKSFNNIVEITIEDSGLGIPTEFHNRIWDPFFTSKEVSRGTGLGLAISRRFAEQHKGKLSLDVSSKNTRFVLRLPKSNDLETNIATL